MMKTNERTSQNAFFFWNWLEDGVVEMMESRRQMQLEGVLFDVEENDDRIPSWGERPATREERKQHVQQHFAQNPPLTLTQNNYLISEPPLCGNPVLTLKQSEVILFYADLRAFFMRFLWSLAGGWSQAGGDENDPLYIPLGYGDFQDREQQERVRIFQPFWNALWEYRHR